MGRNKRGVASYGKFDAGEEVGCWNWGDRDVGGGVGKASSVRFGAKYINMFVWSTEGYRSIIRHGFLRYWGMKGKLFTFQAFIGLLTIVQTWREAVNS